MQRENINHWESVLWVPGSWNSSTFVHLSCGQVVGQSCSVQLPSPSAGPGWWELPCSVRNFKESPSTLKLWGQGHSKENSPTARAVGASTTIPHLTTCTDQRHQQGLRADLTQDSTQCPHPTSHRGRTAVPTTSSLWLSVCLFTRAAFLNMPTVKSCIRGVPGLWPLMSNYEVTYETKMHPQKQLLWRQWEI